MHFFDYVMEGKKGVKMPRGNKDDIQKYRIPIPPIEEQGRIVSQIEALELEIAKARNLIKNAASYPKRRTRVSTKVQG